MEHEWIDGQVRGSFRVTAEGLFHYRISPVEQDFFLVDTPVAYAAAREILRLAEREAHTEQSRTSLAQALGADGDATFGEMIEELEALIRSRDRLAGELGAVRETIAILDASAKDAGGGTAPLWSEIHHLFGRLEKASEEIGRLKGELAIARERAGADGGQAAVLLARALAAEARAATLNEKLAEERVARQRTEALAATEAQAALFAKGRLGDFLDRAEGLERENERLRDGIEKARRLLEPLVGPGTIETVDLMSALNSLKAAAEGTHDPLVNGMKRAFLPGGDAVPEALMEDAAPEEG